MTNRVVVTVGAILAALLIAVAILLIVLIQQNNAAAERADHARIVAICETQFAGDVGAMASCIADLRSR